MNRKLARMLVRMYPRAWRERYGAEFTALLEERPDGFGAVFDVMGSAVRERAFPVAGGTMMAESSRWENFGKRAPWAVFGVAPVALLAVSYCVALLILWTGWRMFLPAEKTPFVPIHGWAIAYFGVGRLLYFLAPMLVGVGIAWAAVQARVKAIWPVAGMALIAFLGGMAQVRARWPSASSSGKVSMVLEFRDPGYAAGILAISVLLFLLLRIRRDRRHAA